MTRSLFLTFLLVAVSCAAASAQKIRFEKTLAEAESKSRAKGKPLFILIDAASQSPEAYLAGFNTPEVQQKFSDAFISFRTSREDAAVSSPIIAKYGVGMFPAFIFIDSQGGLLFRDAGNTTSPNLYLDMAKRCMEEVAEKSIVEYDQEYASGRRDTAFLKEYILKRRKAGMTRNAHLIDEYVKLLLVKELDDYQTILFILQTGPTADSKTYKLAYTNPTLIDSIYRTEPVQKQTAINNTIIDNSMFDAIASKSVKKAIAAAGFASSVWGKDYLQGQKNYSLRMMQYYQAVNDSSNYLSQATRHYDLYYMSVSADSVKRMEKAGLENIKKAAKKAALADPDETGKPQLFAFSRNTIAIGLNNAAFTFIQMGTKDPNRLSKAMLWSMRSIELDPRPTFYDTLAHILYHLRFYTEAESTQQKAIDLAKSKKQDYKGFAETLGKMQKRTL